MAANPRIYHDNRFDDATPVASTTAAGYDVLNLRDFRDFTFWKPTALPATVTVDCGSAKAADYALIHGEAATYEVRGSTDNFSASDVLLASATTTALGTKLIQFTSQSFRYWRIRITGATAPAVAVAAIGVALDLTVPITEGFDPIGREIRGDDNRSEEGRPLGRVINFELWSETVALEFVSWTWLRSTFMPAWTAHLRAEPFGFAWDAQTFPDEVRLVVAGMKLGTPHRIGGFVDLTLELSGIA